MGDKKQREKQEVARDKMLPRSSPSDLRLSATSHLLKFPEPLKIAPTAGDQAFNTRVCGGPFIF
jgi:hypothetical protein